MNREKSKGHLAFVAFRGQEWELFVRDGSIFRAPASAPVMPDGYRSGRWEGFDRPSTRAYLSEVWGVDLP